MTKSYGINSDAGNQVAGNVDEATCLALCSADSLCLAIDYAIMSRSCFVHRSNPLPAQQANSCCNRYTRCSSFAPSLFQILLLT